MPTCVSTRHALTDRSAPPPVTQTVRVEMVDATAAVDDVRLVVCPFSRPALLFVWGQFSLLFVCPLGSVFAREIWYTLVSENESSRQAENHVRGVQPVPPR